MAKNGSGQEQRFSALFQQATNGCEPLPYQKRLALSDPVPSFLDIPTGLGKTAGAILAWIWRRRFAVESIRNRTPRRLVYCLPMRVLVEQTRENAVRWLNRLDLLGGRAKFNSHRRLIDSRPHIGRPEEITVHVLMGGEKADDWDVSPERDMILIGTQDMLLSRALNRGYAASRARWPMQFGLLHTDSLWVYDEVQLMGSGLATTAQLEAFRHRLGSQEGPGCRSVWMSATLNEDWLNTVDFKEILGGLPPGSRLTFDFKSEIEARGIAPAAKQVLEDRWKARKPLSQARSVIGDNNGLTNEIIGKHEDRRGLTLVVVNTVRRAQELHQEIERQVSTASAPRLLLLHSRFRPPERERKIIELLDKNLNQNMLCVSTQVVEAGVDVDAITLFTELAPWASLVQRFGRCNRRGERNELATVWWIDVPNEDAAPYEPPALQEARKQLEEIEAKPSGEQNVGLQWLPDLPLKHEHTHVIRRRDLIDLFDTTPDLAGNDVDIDRYVREIEDTDVRIHWREWDLKAFPTPPDHKAWRRVGREELCPAPVGEFKKFTKSSQAKGKVWCWDFLEGQWKRVDDQSNIYPGQTYLVHASAGGYDLDTGWVGTDGKATVDPLGPVDPEGLSDDAYDDDGLSKTDRWQTIAEHTNDVCRELEEVLNVLPLTGKEPAVLRAAARWHDWGKVHEKFQIKIDDGQELAASDTDGQPRYRRMRPEQWRGCSVVAKAPGERVDWQGTVQDPGYWSRITAKDRARRYFRHELASALGVLQKSHPDLEKFSDEDLNLVAYLIAAHHGKVRLSIRSLPGEQAPDNPMTLYARGVWDGDQLPEVDLGNGVTAPPVTLSLQYMQLGRSQDGDPSWAERMLKLRDALNLGPFRLAHLEALLRAADMRASQRAAQHAHQTQEVTS